MRCLITGCCLHHLNSARFAHGDLFEEVSGAYVFMANQHSPDSDRPGETVWEREPTSPRVLAVQVVDFFDRRGVIVVPKDRCAMNDSAKKRAHGEGTVTL